MGRTKLQAKVEPAPKRWLNKQEAMAYLGVGEDYLSKLSNEAKVSFSQEVMKVLPLTFIWCISFVTMGFTCLKLEALFWISLFILSLCSIYMSKHRKRLEREIDELFGDN